MPNNSDKDKEASQKPLEFSPYFSLRLIDMTSTEFREAMEDARIAREEYERRHPKAKLAARVIFRIKLKKKLSYLGLGWVARRIKY